MKISIIIPIYNVSPYIERCLNSVLMQNCTEKLECILVNDCTPDNSVALAQEIINRYHGSIDVKLFHHKRNKGLSAARNTGIQYATGDYLYFLDSDDEITPNCINVLCMLAVKYKGVDIVQGNIVVMSETLRWLEISQYSFPEYTTDIDWIRRNIFYTFPVTATNKLIKRDFVLRYDLWFREGIIHEDEHWKYFAYRRISSIAFCEEPIYVYYINENSITSNKYKDKSFHSCLCIFNECIPTLERKGEYEAILLRLAYQYKNISSLKDPVYYIQEYKKLLRRQLFSKKVPLSVKMSFLYLYYPCLFIKTVCYLFFKRSYHVICKMRKT